MNAMKVGRITGTGAAINVSLGFIPDYVKLFNPNDAGALWPTLEWTAGMADASGFKTLKSVDSGATGNASSNKITTNGITPFNGSATAAKGFTIGADADINVSGEDISFVAFRGTDGAFGKRSATGVFQA